MAKRARSAEERLLRRKFSNKKKNAKQDGIGCFLSFEDYCSLVKEAGIKAKQITHFGYHLARYNDTGPYAIGNCRFIPWIDNMRERKVDGARISRVLKKYYKTHPSHWIGRKHRQESKDKIGAANSISMRGERNSQFGTYWITNGTNNRKWREDKGNPPRGFKRGRICAVQLSG